MFIGCVNKSKSNYGKLQPSIFINLFRSYCCLFYGSILWKFNSTEFGKICKYWNITIHTWLKLLYNTHTYYLGPRIGQLHLKLYYILENLIYYGILPDYQNVLLKLVFIMTDLHQTL